MSQRNVRGLSEGWSSWGEENRMDVEFFGSSVSVTYQRIKYGYARIIRQKETPR